VGDGKNHWPLVYDRDLADLYARLATNADASGIFHANDEGDERVNDIVGAIKPYLPVKPDVRYVPIEEARNKMGLYADAVKAYKENFPNIHIMWYDEFRKEPQKVLRGVFEFLGVNPDVSIDYARVWNKGGKRWKNPVLRWLFMSDNVVKKTYKVFFPKRKGARTNEFITQRFMEKTEPMNPETRKKLIEFFNNDIMRLQKVTGKDLNSWLQ